MKVVNDTTNDEAQNWHDYLEEQIRQLVEHVLQVRELASKKYPSKHNSELEYVHCFAPGKHAVQTLSI